MSMKKSHFPNLLDCGLFKVTFRTEECQVKRTFVDSNNLGPLYLVIETPQYFRRENAALYPSICRYSKFKKKDCHGKGVLRHEFCKLGPSMLTSCSQPKL